MRRQSLPVLVLPLCLLASPGPAVAASAASTSAAPKSEATPDAPKSADAKPLRINFSMAQTDYELGTPVLGQLVEENAGSTWISIPDAADITKNLRLVVDGKEVAPKSPEKFGAAKTKDLGPGGLVGVTFDLSLMFPELAKPGAYAIAYRGAGAALEPIPFRMIPAFDPAKKHRLTLQTPDGPIAIDLNAGAAPVAVRNVVNLAHTGFYEGADVARIEPNVMFAIRGPVTPRHRIVPFEGTSAEFLAGTVLLEAAGGDRERASYPNLIVLLAPAPALQGRYTVVGQVVDGFETLKKLGARPTTGKDGAPPFKPQAPVAVSKAVATATD